MRLQKLNKGDRLLVVESSLYPDDISEITILEIGKNAIKIKYSSGAEVWETNHTVVKWKILERLPSNHAI